MSCSDPWACNQPCDGTCSSSPYGRVLTMTSEVGATVRTAPGRRVRASTQGLDPTPRGEREKGPDMQNTQQSPPGAPRREKWRLLGRRPIKGHGAMGDFYLWERDEPGALYPMRYGVPVRQFWVA
jgi:hypothetical protein